MKGADYSCDVNDCSVPLQQRFSKDHPCTLPPRTCFLGKLVKCQMVGHSQLNRIQLLTKERSLDLIGQGCFLSHCLLPVCHNDVTSHIRLLPTWTELFLLSYFFTSYETKSEIIKQYILLPLCTFCWVFCHSDAKVTYSNLGDRRLVKPRINYEAQHSSKSQSHQD